MNPTGNSHFNQARIEWAIRLRYSPMPELDMQRLAQYLNAFRIGELREVGKIWEIMYERDPEWSVNSIKRKADAASLDWQVVSDGSLKGDQHAVALQYFYDNLKATKALDQDSTGGTDRLIFQTLSSLDYYYSIHEMLLEVRNPAQKEITAEFREVPIWFMESRRGYLGYMAHIFDMYGQPCVNGEWLTAVNQGWARSLSLMFALKAFAMRDWAAFNQLYGSGFLVGKTTAEPGTQEWDDGLAALTTLANEAKILTNDSLTFSILEQGARNANPFHPMVQYVDGTYAKCYRGIDLATSSRSGQGSSGSGPGSGGGGPGKPVGASVQKEESGIFLVDDCKFITGVFNERIDRPIIRYLFAEEPRAWFALMPPESDTSAQMLQAVQALVPMGLRIALKDIYKAFRIRVPDAGDPCLTPAVGAAPASGDTQDEPQGGAGSSGPGSGAKGNSQKPMAKSQVAVPAAVLPAEKPKTDDGKTLPAQTTDADPIAPGADPGRWGMAANPGMPDTQVDAAAFWSLAGVLSGRGNTPKGADGQALPALGYVLPNERYENLRRIGLGNSKAAQGIKSYLTRRSNLDVAIPGLVLSNAAVSPAEYIAATQKALAPLREKLLAILKIKDGDQMLDALRQFRDDQPGQLNLLAQMNAAPAAARIIRSVMTEGLASAFAGRRRDQSVLANGDAPGHGFHGNQYTDSAGKIKDVLSGKLDESAYAKVSPETAAKIKAATGQDVSGYSHFIDRDALTHIDRQHGVGKEDQAGHQPVTKDDIEKIPQIVANPDLVEKGQTGRGLLAIKYTKRFNGSTYYVEEQWSKEKLLAAKTMYKTETPGNSATPKGGVSHTSETSGA